MKSYDAFLRLLRVDKWSDDPHRDCTCYCPAHDDRNPSMTVRLSDDDKRIMVNCHRGCSAQDIARSLGLEMKDLYIDDLVPGQRVYTAKKTKTSPSAPSADASPQRGGQGNGTEEKRKPPRMVWPPEKVYDYTDEDGNLLFNVLRFKTVDDETGEVGKTFRQGLPDPTRHSGWKMGLPAGLRKPLYRLPEVLKAIADGKPVYVVEGEKDADNLARLGRCATTNAGGASGKGKIKWLPEHTETLRGAEVIILPDVDDTGLEDRKQVAKLLLGVAKSVRYIDLRKGYPEMPKKGDISDLMQLVGDEQALAILDNLTAATEPMSDQPPKPKRDPNKPLTHYEQICDMYNDQELYGGENGAGRYGVRDGCMCRWDKRWDKMVPLCNFVASVKETRIRDDGEDERVGITIEGWTQTGRPMKDAETTMDKLSSGEWVKKAWPMIGVILPGSTTRDYLRYMLEMSGTRNGQLVTEYAHTGWRRIGNHWCYLSPDSTVGQDGVEVKLESQLSGYTLGAADSPAYDRISPMDALMASRSLPLLLPMETAVPLMAMTYLAPLQEALAEVKCPVDFILYLVGRNQSGKSATAMLLQNHFGSFTHFPSNFKSSMTVSKINAFVLKDTLNVMDDYKPDQSAQSRKRMNDIFQDMVRGYSDGNFRQTANQDGTLKKSMRARGVCLATGESLPDIGESGLARLYVVEMNRSSINIMGNPEKVRILTNLQRQGNEGYFRKAMRGYIEWLAPQMDELPETLRDRFIRYRELASSELGKEVQARAPSAVAHLMIGYEMLLEYSAVVMGTGGADWGSEEMKGERLTAWKALIDGARAGARETKSESPISLFFGIVSESLTSGRATVIDLEDENRSKYPPKDMIGYKDSGFYYFLSKPLQELLGRHMQTMSEDFPVSIQALLKMLAEDGMLKAGSDGKNTRPKRIDGKLLRLIWIPVRYIDGTEEAPESQQEAMDMGYTVVNEPPPF